MNWTCCECENQVDERYYDLDERMCYECLDDDEEVILEIKKSIQELHPQPIAEVEEIEHQ
tara:strand:- start:297 stop:476 length:180 start_codon:yes stop_codon:yes gene_type:complete